MMTILSVSTLFTITSNLTNEKIIKPFASFMLLNPSIPFFKDLSPSSSSGETHRMTLYKVSESLISSTSLSICSRSHSSSAFPLQIQIVSFCSRHCLILLLFRVVLFIQVVLVSDWFSSLRLARYCLRGCCRALPLSVAAIYHYKSRAFFEQSLELSSETAA